MPIIQDRDVKFPYKRYRYIYMRFRLKAIVSQWFYRCTTVGVFVWKKDGAGSNLGMFFFFFFFCQCMCGNVTKGLFIFRI